MTTDTGVLPLSLPLRHLCRPIRRRSAPRAAGRRALRGLSGLVLLGLALIAGRPQDPVRGADRLTARRTTLAAALAAPPPGAVLIAGNSHAQLAAQGGSPCTPLVDAGFPGARAGEVAGGLSGLRAAAPARLGLLLVGTNDIRRGAAPLSRRARTRFAAGAAAGLAWLGANADAVVVAAVPPIGPAAAAKRDPAAVEVYSAILRGLCRDTDRCRFADPFAALRSEEPGLAWPGALTDAIHLADYPAMLAALALCPAEAQRPAGSAASASGVSR